VASTYFIDTFDGTAGVFDEDNWEWLSGSLLVGHTTSNGAAYHKGDWGLDLIRDGSGGVYGDYEFGGGPNEAFVNYLIPSTDYYVEVDVNIPATADSGADIALLARLQPNGSSYFWNGGLETNNYVDLDYFPTTGRLYMGMYGRGADEWGSDYDIGTITGNVTLRLEVEGTTGRYFVNGALKRTFDINAVTIGGHVGLRMNSRSVHIKALEMRVGGL
jgi:hypothetical protein